MRKWLMCAIATTIGIAVLAGEVAAQVFTPTYMAPVRSSDIGLYLSDGPGEFAFEGILRRSFGTYDLGIRAGVADTRDLSLLVGGEWRHPLAASAPIDFAVTGFAQGLFGDFSGGGFMVGLSMGHTFTSPELSIIPYFHPRIGAVNSPGPDSFDLELLADLGFDLRFSQNLDLRFGITFADEGGAEFGAGLAWR
jgi:hypothetical protein